MANLTHEELTRILDYSPRTGAFWWKTDAGLKPVRLHKAASPQINISGMKFTPAKLAWTMVHGHYPKGQPIYRNGNKHDYRIENILFKDEIPEAPSQPEEIIKFEELVKMGRDKGPFSRMMEITPDLADHILGKNPDNRKINKASLSRIVSDIESGHWQENGETVIISKEGDLNDGQTRLNAVLIADRSIKTMVAFGIDRATRTTVDIGTKRLNKHFLEMAHIPHASLASSAANVILNIQAGHHTSEYVAPQEVVDFCVGNEDLQYATTTALRVYKRIRFAPGYMAAFIYLALQGAHRDRVEGFMEGIEKGLGLRETDVIYKLRSQMERETRGRNTSQNIHTLKLVIKAWNAYVDGRKVGVLRARDDEEMPSVA